MPNTIQTKKINLESLPDKSLVRNFETNSAAPPKQLLIGLAIIVAAGALSGFILSNLLTGKGQLTRLNTGGGTTASGKTVGSADTKTFPDLAEGKLEAGGIDGEGTHKLIRPGGDNQTVYLTSSVLDLNQFVGKKVKIWGQTYAAKRAGWLMDVGRVEVL